MALDTSEGEGTTKPSGYHLFPFSPLNHELRINLNPSCIVVAKAVEEADATQLQNAGFLQN